MCWRGISHALFHLILVTDCEAGTIIIPISQKWKPKLRKNEQVQVAELEIQTAVSLARALTLHMPGGGFQAGKDALITDKWAVSYTNCTLRRPWKVT